MSDTRSHDPQPAPIPNSGASVTDAVVTYIHGRREFGIGKYGTELCTNNGRDALLDMRDELADAMMYVTQEIMERDERLAAAVAKGRRDVVRVLARRADSDSVSPSFSEDGKWIAAPSFRLPGKDTFHNTREEAIAEVIQFDDRLTISPEEIADALTDKSEVVE